MENTAQISDAFLVKLVTQLMTHGAAGFCTKQKTVRDIAQFALNVPGTCSAFRMDGTGFKGHPNLSKWSFPSWGLMMVCLLVNNCSGSFDN